MLKDEVKNKQKNKREKNFFKKGNKNKPIKLKLDKSKDKMRSLHIF